MAMKFGKKAIRNTEICKKQANFNQNKQATRKSSKKTANPQKDNPKFVGKLQGWQHCPRDVRIWKFCNQIGSRIFS